MSRTYLDPVSIPDQQSLNRAATELFQSRQELSGPSRAAIRSILYKNLETGRISRRFDGRPSAKPAGVVLAYVTSVCDFYLGENSRLLALAQGCAESWIELIDWLKRCAYVKLHQINATASLVGLTADDFTQEISLWLIEAMSEVKLTPEERFSPAAGQSIGYTYDAPFSDWIAKVQSRRILDAARRASRQDSAESAIDVELIPAEDILSGSLERMMLKQAMSRLTAHQRQVIEQLTQGISVREVAERLNCTGRAVYNRKYAAISRLRRLDQPGMTATMA